MPLKLPCIMAPHFHTNGTSVLLSKNRYNLNLKSTNSFESVKKFGILMVTGKLHTSAEDNCIIPSCDEGYKMAMVRYDVPEVVFEELSS